MTNETPPVQPSSVLTVTVNPSLDTTSKIDRVGPNIKLRTRDARHDPGGGGLNVTRAMRTLGAHSSAVWTKGGTFGAHVANLLDERGIDHIPIEIEGDTKQSFAVIEMSTGDHYRFSEPGPALKDSEEESLAEEIVAREPGWLVLSGGTSPEMSEHLFANLAEVGSRAGANVVVDTHGETLRLAVSTGRVTLIKPNLRELGELVEADIEGQREAVTKAAQRIIAEHGVGAIVTSLGSAGAVLVTADSSEMIDAPNVEEDSQIGAGDSMVAGIVASLLKGESIRSAARLGVAAGTAAVLTPATQLCRRDDTEWILRSMSDA